VTREEYEQESKRKEDEITVNSKTLQVTHEESTIDFDLADLSKFDQFKRPANNHQESIEYA